MAKERAHAKKKRIVKKMAHKRATALYAKEKTKTERAKMVMTTMGPNIERGMSASKVKEVVELEFGVGMAPSRRTIETHAAKGSVGESPIRRGHPGRVVQSTFLMFCTALESYVQIFQINAKVEPRKLLSAKCYSVMQKEDVVSNQLLVRVLQECACDLLAD